MRCRNLIVIVVAGVWLVGVTGCGMQRLSKEVYVDKCKGAWAGQMIGVCYAAPYEFHYNGRIMEDSIPPWNPENVRGATGQDDCYVEITWLKALEKYGLDISNEQAGQTFAETRFGLAHANHFGRENCRHGILPPRSGHPQYNRCADDIDFQIEADILGIICPGLPRESNRLGDIFGHIMNHGDGVYGGLFVAGMYATAFFEDKSVEKVVRTSLACIPTESLYYRCVADVLAWHKENPDDWRATWRRIEEKWNDDIDCTPGNPFNIDARLNGAYVVLGLLYGQGDFLKTMEIATRCGQDSDCNASTAVGVLGCMKGYVALGEGLTGGIAAIEDKKFSHTDYSFKTLIPACQRMAEKIIRRAGGRVTDEAYLIPSQRPRPARLEQWDNQMEIIQQAILPHQVEFWNAGWKVLDCGGLDLTPGLYSEHAGYKNVLMVHPVSREKPAILAAELVVSQAVDPKLYIDTASHKSGDYLLKVAVNGKPVMEMVIASKGEWTTQTVDLAPHAGQKVEIRLEAHANDWMNEFAYFGKVEIR